MSLIRITEAMELMEKADADISMEDKEFIAQYAFRTGDTDLIKKLILELQEKDTDKEAIKTKYMQLADKKTGWAEKIENLLIALEMYRIEEEKAVKRITDFLTAHGIDISETVVRDADVNELKNMISEVKDMPEQGAEVMQTEKAAVL